MKKFISLFSVLFMYLVIGLGTVYATPIDVSTFPKPYFTADLQFRVAGGNYHYTNNSYVSPLKLTLDGEEYDAYCIDLFESVYTGSYNNYSIMTVEQYMTGSYATANGHYNDPRNLEYALYNMEKHQYLLTDIEHTSYAQLNLWNTLYDFYPSGNSGQTNNMHWDSNFFATDINRVDNLGCNPYDTAFANFNTTYTGVDGIANNTYNNAVLNAISGGKYTNMTDNYRVIQFGTGIGIQELIIRIDSPVPEPATMLLLGMGLIGLAGITRKNS